MPKLKKVVRVMVRIEKHILGYFRHVVRRYNENLEKGVFIDTISSKRGNGSTTTMWPDIIHARMDSAVSATAEASTVIDGVIY